MGWTTARPDPIWVKTPNQVGKLREQFAANRVAAIDTETTGVDIARDTVMFWSISFGDDRYFLERALLPQFEKVFADPDRTWIGSHTKFDAHMLANSGMYLAGTLFCTLVMDRLLNADADHGLKDTYERYFHEHQATFAETFYPRGKENKPYKPKGKTLQEIMMTAWNDNKEGVVDYASMDAWASHRVYRHLRRELNKVTTWRGETLWELYRRFEAPFTRVLYAMEHVGIQLDTAYLKSLRPRIQDEMGELESRLNKIAGVRININSIPQLNEFFVKKLHLPALKKTKGGAVSIDALTLEAWAAGGSKAAAVVLKYRKLSKILSTNVEGLLSAADQYGRVHGNFNQHVTETARLSSTEPNLQNIPRPGSEDKDPFQLRRAFIARPGYEFMSADYDQIEMYVVAHFANAVGMIKNIKAGRDIHSSNVEIVWGEPYDDVVAAKKKDKKGLTEYDKRLLAHRQFAKVIGFGLNYGKGSKKLAAELGFDKQIKEAHPDWSEFEVVDAAKRKAQKVIDRYFAGIPEVKAFIEETKRVVAKQKFVETLIGRRRPLPEVMDLEEQWRHDEAERRAAMTSNRNIEEIICWCPECKESRGGERKAVSTIIQGSAADIIQDVMITMYDDKNLHSIDMVLQVHDEVAFEVPKGTGKEAAARVKYLMEHPSFDDLRVPLSCSPGVADNWIAAK
jgi:DNA polymerase-1